MVMIHDKKTNRVVVEKRVKSWKGIAFPGGHVEENESFVDSAIREVHEETGLVVKNLQSCGLIHWYSPSTHDRYMVFLYRTSDFEGTILTQTDEGAVWWADLDQLTQMELCENFEQYLTLFLNDTYNELFCDMDSKQMMLK